MKHKYLLASFISLLSGTVIYLLFRPSSLYVFSWFDALHIDFLNWNIRKLAFSNYTLFPDWFLYALPDGLWIFSYVSLMLYIWNFKLNFASIFWISIVPLVAVLSEIGQWFKLVQGTFDISDLAFYILGAILPLLFAIQKNDIKFIKLNNYEQKS